jgi:hypothetical protein
MLSRVESPLSPPTMGSSASLMKQKPSESSVLPGINGGGSLLVRFLRVREAARGEKVPRGFRKAAAPFCLYGFACLCRKRAGGYHRAALLQRPQCDPMGGCLMWEACACVMEDCWRPSPEHDGGVKGLEDFGDWDL